MPTHLILYGTYGCHLCEEAHQLLAQAVADRPVDIEEVDILDDPELEQRYGVRIPIVREPVGGAELGWPFDHARLAEFLAELDAG